MNTPSEPMPQLFSKSKIIILDFTEITNETPKQENIKLFFKEMINRGHNPRLPENRQKFNDEMLEKSNCRYLVGRYGEDRKSMLTDTKAGKEGRTIHVALDIFSRDLEPVMAPYEGEIITSDYEEGFGEYGNYLIFKPDQKDYCIFFGHLAGDRLPIGRVKANQTIAHLGDFLDNENGGWSRHLHLQILKNPMPDGSTPPGYSTKEDFEKLSLAYPDPMNYFPAWNLQ